MNESKFNRLTSGFTLVELLLYMALLSIWLLVLSGIFISVLETRTESEAVSAVEQDGRFIIARLSYDASRASSVTVPVSLGSTASSLSIIIGGVEYSYAVAGGNLQLTNDVGTHNLNSSETIVENPVFQRIGNIGGKDTIRVQFTLTSVTVRAKGPESKTFTTTVGRR